MLNYSQPNIDSFWNLCNAPVSELMEQLHEKCMPKAVLNVHCTVNPIKKMSLDTSTQFQVHNHVKIKIILSYFSEEISVLSITVEISSNYFGE
jgi:hypothetical protein